MSPLAPLALVAVAVLAHAPRAVADSPIENDPPRKVDAADEAALPVEVLDLAPTIIVTEPPRPAPPVAPAGAVTAHARRPVARPAEPTAFDAPLGLGVGYVHHGGDRDGHGVRGGVAWRPLRHLEVGLAAELVQTATATGGRYELPFGVALAVPLDLGAGLRVRALAGVGAALIVPERVGVDSGEPAPEPSLELGVEVGGGLAWAFASRWSVFADATWRRAYGRAATGGDLAPFDRLVVAFGVELHVAP